MSDESVPPNSHIIDLHSLRKYCASVGTTNKVSAHSHVKDDEELTLKLGGAINSTSDVSFVVLDLIHIPLDRRRCACNRERVEARCE